jgi:hypothetical protein
MAANGLAVPPNDIQMVMDVTGFGDRAMIANALRSRGNVESVINEYLDDAAKVDISYAACNAAFRLQLRAMLTLPQFRRQYGWDESAFSSSRDSEDTSGNTNTAIPCGYTALLILRHAVC